MIEADKPADAESIEPIGEKVPRREQAGWEAEGGFKPASGAVDPGHELL